MHVMEPAATVISKVLRALRGNACVTPPTIVFWRLLQCFFPSH